MRETTTVAVDSNAGEMPAGRIFSRTADSMIAKALESRLAHITAGRLRLTLPSGRNAVLGSAAGPAARLNLRSYGAIWQCLRRGYLGVAESYIDGSIETEDLRAVFDFFCANETALTMALPQVANITRRDARFHASRRNTLEGSKRNIAAHYDLGNAFYRLWLDPTMSYSSAIYDHPRMSLEAAQETKYRRILASLDLFPGAKLLEIGCGWGGLAIAAAESGAAVTALTISAEQQQEARARVAAAGIAAKVDVCFQDYRHCAGAFDRIVSVEMIEAVGEENWPQYFRIMHDRLVPGGHAVIQAITIREDLVVPYRSRPDFIQRYIFPGGVLPSESEIANEARRAGLTYERIQTFGDSYARTLADWRQRFEHNWPAIEKLGFDERFRRMWRYYLIYCEVGFQNGMIDVGLYRFRKPTVIEQSSVLSQSA